MANKTIYPYGVGGETPSGIDIVDYTTGGQDKAASAESVKELAQYVFMGSGTFGDAYDKAKTTLAYFPWLLEDTDKDGNAIKKMIWHVGNKKFIDAIGAEITGIKNGITINVSEPCRMILNGKSFSLPTGETNISFEEVGASYAPWPSFLMPDSDESAKSLVESIDFGGFDLFGRDESWYPIDGMLSGFPNITRVERLSMAVNNPYDWRTSVSAWSFSTNDNLEYISMVGTRTFTALTESFSYMSKLRKVDFSKTNYTITSSIYRTFAQNPVLEEVDISGWDTSSVTNFDQFLYLNAATLRKFTIGNFSNAAMTSKEYAFGNISDCVLICTTSTPPVLKNCAFSNDVAQDEWASTYDWLSTSDGVCHFSAIYVPADSVDTYKENTYIENGTVGNTGWSKYADIIHPITEYNG